MEDEEISFGCRVSECGGYEYEGSGPVGSVSWEARDGWKGGTRLVDESEDEEEEQGNRRKGENQDRRADERRPRFSLDLSPSVRSLARSALALALSSARSLSSLSQRCIVSESRTQHSSLDGCRTGIHFRQRTRRWISRKRQERKYES